MLDQSVVPMLLFTIYGHVYPIGGNGRRGESPVAPRLARGLHVTLGRGKSMPRGLGALMLTL
jgi:hypothetical protein